MNQVVKKLEISTQRELSDLSSLSFLKNQPRLATVLVHIFNRLKNKNSRRNYDRAISRWLDFFECHEVKFDMVTKEQALLYFETRSGAPTTRNLEINIIKSFYQIAEDLDIVKSNPVKVVKKVKDIRDVGRILTAKADKDVITEIIEFKDLDILTYKEMFGRFAILFLSYTGMRSIDLVRMSFNDLKYSEEGDFYFKFKEKKTNLERIFTLSDSALEALDQYLDQLELFEKRLVSRARYKGYVARSKEEILSARHYINGFICELCEFESFDSHQCPDCNGLKQRKTRIYESFLQTLHRRSKNGNYKRITTGYLRKAISAFCDKIDKTYQRPHSLRTLVITELSKTCDMPTLSSTFHTQSSNQTIKYVDTDRDSKTSITKDIKY
jgi:integrase